MLADKSSNMRGFPGKGMGLFAGTATASNKKRAS
jgi:hypothetical protein